MIKYNNQNIHKLILYILQKSEGDVLVELKEHDRAIKCYKSLKNYCKKWQMHHKIYQKFKRQKIPLMKGTDDFKNQIMSLYNQIGYLYREMKMHRSAMDMFKK